MSTNKKRTFRRKRYFGWSLASQCQCCGRIIVLVRAPDRPLVRIPVYIRSWDGNPWYDRSVHKKHILARYKKAQEDIRLQKAGGDPFFLLD